MTPACRFSDITMRGIQITITRAGVADIAFYVGGPGEQANFLQPNTPYFHLL
jgi:hypothetical protein